MSSLDSFFESVKLPSIPEVAHALIKTLNDHDVSLIELRNIIAQDPALCAKLLRLANSAQFGLPRGVGTLDDAMAMVGLSKIRTLSLGTYMDGAFPALPGLNRNDYWKNSMACAGYAQWLADCLHMDTQQAWLTGMMLRLGELLIGQVEPKTLLEIEKLLAALLADTPYTGPDMLDSLPLDVVDSFQTDVQWRTAKFPLADSFIDITAP